MSKLRDSTEITCLPYTRSPFSIPDKVKSISLKDAKINPRFRFDPTSIKYPVVSGAYLLAYRVQADIPPTPNSLP